MSKNNFKERIDSVKKPLEGKKDIFKKYSKENGEEMVTLLNSVDSFFQQLEKDIKKEPENKEFYEGHLEHVLSLLEQFAKNELSPEDIKHHNSKKNLRNIPGPFMVND